MIQGVSLFSHAEHQPDEIRSSSGGLASEFYSHVHAISRNEAREILGDEQIDFANQELENCLDRILRTYELTFRLREQYVLKEEIKNNTSLDVNYCGGIFESEKRSYVFKTKGAWFQTPKLPAGVQLNVPAGSALPLIPGLPVEFRFDIKSIYTAVMY